MLKLSALAGAFLALLAVRLLQPAAELLFAAHMAQHLLLIAIAAPLLVLAGLEIRMPPLAGWGLFVGIFLFWHWPFFFRWVARQPYGELLELGSILAAACCFWGVVMASGRLSDPARALMVMTAAILTDLPGVVMLFAPVAICTMPAENAARFGLTPLSDQQLAGLLMWVPANLVFFGVATFLFARWIGAHHRVVTS
jgi:cytochrome c oxidase assembly factor CtaG